PRCRPLKPSRPRALTSGQLARSDRQDRETGDVSTRRSQPASMDRGGSDQGLGPARVSRIQTTESKSATRLEGRAAAGSPPDTPSPGSAMEVEVPLPRPDRRVPIVAIVLGIMVFGSAADAYGQY